MERIEYEIKNPDVNPDLLIPGRAGDHVWVAIAAFRISPESMVTGGQVHMDRENLASINVGCYVCETPYDTRMIHRRCPGEPRD